MEDPKVKTNCCLGGWRNKVTGDLYFNMSTQTGRNCQDKTERTAQTDFLVDKFTNVEHNAGVQTNFFPDVRDKIVESTSKDWGFRDPTNEKILESVVKIQRFYSLATPWHKLEQNLQQHLFKCLFDVVHRAHRGRQTASQPTSVSTCSKNRGWQRIEGEPGCYRSRDFVILNRTSPRTRADFELLYNLLDRWRICETERAAEQLFEPSRIALGSLILSKEVELLRAIDSMKTSVKSEKKEEKYRQFLDELSKPVVWKNHRDEPIYVETPRVQRAKNFKATFEALSKEDVSTKERLATLIELRKNIELHTCKESQELLNLLDQEIDFLNLKVDESKLQWLRRRSRMAFLRLAREALKYEREGSNLIGHFRSGCKTICRSCGRLLSAEKFPRENRRSFSTCNYCLHVKARTGPRIVYDPYRKLLRDIRRREARLRCYTSLAFVVDTGIVYRLVNDIWHGKSAISENDCLEELRLVRFHNGVDWSPWNSLLLTEKEASLHRKVEDLEKFYGAVILQKFHTKNLQAKVQFGSVAEFESGRERKESLLLPRLD